MYSSVRSIFIIVFKRTTCKPKNIIITSCISSIFIIVFKLAQRVNLILILLFYYYYDYYYATRPPRHRKKKIYFWRIIFLGFHHNTRRKGWFQGLPYVVTCNNVRRRNRRRSKDGIVSWQAIGSAVETSRDFGTNV